MKKLVIFGITDAAELAHYYFNSDSDFEVVAFTVDEAFRKEETFCGLPVVAFDTGGIREWLRDGESGFVAPWMDRVAYAARVQRLLHDPELARRLGAHGRAFAAARFDFSSYVSGLEALFARVAAEDERKAAA